MLNNVYYIDVMRNVGVKLVYSYFCVEFVEENRMFCKIFLLMFSGGDVECGL